MGLRGFKPDHFIEILSRKVIPTSRALSKKRGSTKGPNSHWLSRLPAKTKSYKYRSKPVEFMKVKLVD